MGVDHGRFDVLVPEQFLNGSDIIAVLKHMRGKRMTKGVARGMLDHSRLADGILDDTLHSRLMHVMSSFLASVSIDPPMMRRKHILPT